MHGDAAEQPAHLAHGGRCLDVVAHDVPDDDHDVVVAGPAVLLEERVVPVAADAGRLAGGGVAGDDLEVLGLRRVGEHAALEGLGDVALGLVEAGVVERQAGARADVLEQRDVVLGERRPGVPAEHGDHAHGPSARPQGDGDGGVRVQLAQEVARGALAKHGRHLVGRVVTPSAPVSCRGSSRAR